eukprot:1231458-Amphidinium_carterae.2
MQDHIAKPPMRTAYDCAPKCCRAHFLALLNRALSAEVIHANEHNVEHVRHVCSAKVLRYGDTVRGAWSVVMQSYPELGLLRSFLDELQKHVFA